MKNPCKSKEKDRRKCILCTIGIGKNYNKKQNIRIKRLEKESFRNEALICLKLIISKPKDSLKTINRQKIMRKSNDFLY